MLGGGSVEDPEQIRSPETFREFSYARSEA